MQDSNSRAEVRAFRDYDLSVLRAVRSEQRRLRFAKPRLVDVGTGTGEFLLRLARDSWFKDFRLIGTDTSSEMLEVASDIVGTAGLSERILLEQNDVHQLPYADESIEFVTSQSTIHQWDNPVQAFQEIFRVLATNGAAVIHEPRRDIDPELQVALRRKRAKHGLQMDALHERHTPGEVWEMLEQAGLTRHAVINSPSTSIGFEVRLVKTSGAADVASGLTVRAADA
ncbi:MAG: class I SAM-dependent methyltransferase [Planctomycetaceae bacterium]